MSNAVAVAETEQQDAPRKAARNIAPYQRAIANSKERFAKIAGELVDYEKESVFAAQALMKTDFAMKVANSNPTSVHLAMINVASTGLTLNPANGYAYLVPRDGSIVLDISYKGLIKIATDCGAILWARADVVHENDEFVYHGPAMAPEHRAQVFRDRGELIGCYCIAKTADGDILTEIMGRDEIEKIRGKSDLYARKKSGPWVEWFTQMVKKAVIKRASKTWPYTDRMQRLMDAIDLANQAEGGYTLEGEAEALVSEEQAATLRDWIESTGTDLKAFCGLYGVEAVASIPATKYQAALSLLKRKSEAQSEGE
jgi:recombination protein RecT